MTQMREICTLHRHCLHVLLYTFVVSTVVSAEASFVEPVPLQDVTLEANSQFDKAMSLNREYLIGIDSDRLLKTFRMNANLSAPGDVFSGSWEDPSCEVRGQFMGHWLSGTAMLGRHTGDKKIIEKAEHIIEELEKVQLALGKGYLSAFPTEHFTRLRALKPVWAPFYVIHKLMAGLLDHHTFLGNQQALHMAEKEAAFFLEYIEDVLSNEGKDHWISMLEVEYGGMEEVLFNLYAASGNQTWAKMATYFTKPNWLDPLKANQDALPGRHANTHLAQVNGFAAGYEIAGSEDRLKATSNFFDIITSAHSYATGGSNDGEGWQEPRELATTIAAEGAGLGTEETCTTYNMLKIARYLFRWSANPRYADYYERAILNGMLGVQRMPANYSVNALDRSSRRLLDLDPRSTRSHTSQAVLSDLQPRFSLDNTINTSMRVGSTIPPYPGRNLDSVMNWRQLAMQQFPGDSLPEHSNKPGPGVIIYLLPLGAGNTKDDNYHHWSTPLNSFWCCSGSIAESFGKIMDSIYFQRVDSGQPPELFINQFVPSTLTWHAGGLRLTQKVSETSKDNTMHIVISSESSGRPIEPPAAILNIRIPKWAASVEFKIDYGEELNTLEPSKLPFYWRLGIAPSIGARIELKIKLDIRTEPINDHRPEYANLQAILMGPYLMAALTHHDRDIDLSPSEVATHVTDIDTEGLQTLRTSKDLILKQSGAAVEAVNEESCLSKVDCTFRIVKRERSALRKNVTSSDAITFEAPDAYMLESMSMPGMFVSVDKEGMIIMKRQDRISVDDPLGGPLLATRVKKEDTSLQLDFNLEKSNLQHLRIEDPLGSYPENARLLKGKTKSYVIVPIGNLVEERYTPYLQFSPSHGITEVL